MSERDAAGGCTQGHRRLRDYAHGGVGRPHRVTWWSRWRQWSATPAGARAGLRTIVGFRPFRPSGFRVQAEPLGDNKLLVHNYGHGGCGVTLSWGTAHLAAEMVTESGRTGTAAVLGCGVVGLATARLLQNRGFDVTIYARELPPDTTSDIAGASWYPHLIADETPRTAAFTAQFESAARLSHRYFQGLVGDDYGVRWRRQYFLSDAPAPDPWDTRWCATCSAIVAGSSLWNTPLRRPTRSSTTRCSSSRRSISTRCCVTSTSPAAASAFTHSRHPPTSWHSRSRSSSTALAWVRGSCSATGR